MNPSAQDLRIQWEIHFFTFLNIGQNAPKKIRIVIIQYFIRKMLSKSIFDLGNCPNRKAHEIKSACFLIGALCNVQNPIWNQFSHKVLYNYYSNFLLERFNLYLTKSKIGFHIVLSNLARKGSGFFFQGRKLIFLPNGFYLPTEQPWGSPMVRFWYHHL